MNVVDSSAWLEYFPMARRQAAAGLSVDHTLPMADAVILATSRAFDAALRAQDADFASIAGVEYVSAPTRSGRRRT